jgi:hypothetical protein
MLKTLLLCIVCSFLLLVDGYSDRALADQIVNLPGTESLQFSFKQFSGYFDIPGKNGQITKHVHYW